MSAPQTPRKSRFGADLAPRAASGAVMIALALGATYWGGLAFALLWLAAFAAIAWEWQRMASGGQASAGQWPARPRIALSWFALALAAALTMMGAWHWALLAVAAAAVLCACVGPDRAVAAGGVLYAGLPLVAVLALRGDSPAHREVAAHAMYVNPAN